MDTENPEISLVEITEDKIIFSVTDDIGILMDSVFVEIGTTKYRKFDLTKKGKYYEMYIGGVSQNIFKVGATDRVGKETKRSFSKDIISLPSITSADFFNLDDSGNLEGSDLDSYIVGNVWFISKHTKKSVSIYFSDALVVNRIFLDNEEITDYELSSNTLTMSAEFKKEMGDLKITYAKKEQSPFTEATTLSTKNIKYITEDLEPSISLFMPIKLDRNNVLISGVIDNISLMDFDRVVTQPDTFGSSKPLSVFDYGNYFEVIFPIEVLENSRNYLKFGLVNSKNPITREISKISGFTFPEVEIGSKNRISFQTAKTLHFLDFEGFGTQRSILSSQREGTNIFPINLEEEKKDISFEKDTIPPFIRFYKTSDDKYIIIGEDRADGIENIWVSSDNEIECSGITILSYESCVSLNGDDFTENIVVNVTDKSGNSAIAEISKQQFGTQSISSPTPQVYVKDIEIVDSNLLLIGEISTGEINSISVGSERCVIVSPMEFECSLRSWENTLSYVAGISGVEDVVSGNFNIENKYIETKSYSGDSPPQISVTTATSDRLESSEIILSSNSFSLDFKITEPTQIKAFFSGAEILREEIQDNKTFQIPITGFISDEVIEREYLLRVETNYKGFEKNKYRFYYSLQKSFR